MPPAPKNSAQSMRPQIRDSAAWTRIYQEKAAELRQARVAPPVPLDTVQTCAICLDTQLTRSEFQAAGFACYACTDGVVCRACCRSLALSRHKGQFYNTLLCPACKSQSTTSPCLACASPVSLAAAPLVKEFVFVPPEMYDSLSRPSSPKDLLGYIQDLIVILKFQVRLRIICGAPSSPCMPYVCSIQAAFSCLVAAQQSEDPEDSEATAASVRVVAIRVVRAIWPHLNWVHLIGAVCSSESCSECPHRFVMCDECKFLVRENSPALSIDPRTNTARCSTCSGNFSGVAPPASFPNPPLPSPPLTPSPPSSPEAHP